MKWDFYAAYMSMFISITHKKAIKIGIENVTKAYGLWGDEDRLSRGCECEMKAFKSRQAKSSDSLYVKHAAKIKNYAHNCKRTEIIFLTSSWAY